jgi:hypothetical protein
MPRNQLIEQFDRILKIIQRYFTCEGRFNTLCHSHIRLLLHFTSNIEMNVPYYLLRSIGKILDRVQDKSKDVDSSLFHSGLIRMLVSEELGKKEISWEIFVVTSHFKMDPIPTPQSQIVVPSTSTSTKASINKKRKGRAPVLETSKQVMEVEEEICPSPHRYFLPPPPPGLKEVPSSTKLTSNRGTNILFPSFPPTVKIKGKIPFTRSSIPKEVFKEQSLPETPMHKEKGKNIENNVEEKSETPIHRKKGKGTTILLERKDEVFVKDFEEPVKNKGEVVVQEKKHKGKGFEKADEKHKKIPVQME